MFDNARYITREANKRIPYMAQLIMWKMIDTMEVEQDYLQVFEIKPVPEGLKIIHSQEVPSYRKEHILKMKWQKEEKVFVIDDKTHSTMLLAEDY